MKQVMIWLIVFGAVHHAYGQVTPFTGGAGSGFTGKASASISCPLFFGGEADGVAVNKTPAIVCAMFFGGAGDGFDAAQSNCEGLLTEAKKTGNITPKALPQENAIVAGAMKVFPNPASGIATLQIAVATPVRTQILVYRADGQVVRSFPVLLSPGVNTVPLDLQQLASGLYIIYNSARRERVKVMVRAGQ
jgi:hypothetical protein